MQLVKSTLKNKFNVAALLKNKKQPSIDDLIENLDFKNANPGETDHIARYNGRGDLVKNQKK